MVPINPIINGICPEKGGKRHHHLSVRDPIPYFTALGGFQYAYSETLEMRHLRY